MDKQQIMKLTTSLNEIAHFTEDGVEFWYARELQAVLGYTEWRNFVNILGRAKMACENSQIPIKECFVDVNKTSPMPNGGTKTLPDLMLNRYACYLIAQNGDPQKKTSRK